MLPLLKKLIIWTKLTGPICLLSHIVEVFKRIIYNQINEYVEPFLSKLLTGFRKNHNT